MIRTGPCVFLVLSVLIAVAPHPIRAESRTSIVDSGKRVTVAGLERLLSRFGRRPTLGEAAPDPGVKSRDDQMQAVEIDFLRLTQRLTPWTRERLEMTYRLGPQGFDALERIADLSSLLAPPPGDILPDPPPGVTEQNRIFHLALTTGLRNLTHLPMYSLKSFTEYYNNGYSVTTDQNLVSDLIHNYKHRWQGVGPWISSFSVQEGSEPADRNGPIQRPNQMPKPPSFENWGEFGAQPALILSDISTESLRFLRWERSPAGQLAVFHYDVPAATSHYRVTATCGKHMPFHSLPAYQGTISIDPHTGNIVRITMEAESQRKDPVFDLASAIEYGPVRLGDAETNLPQRSLTFMTEDPNVCLGTQGGVESPAGGLFTVDFLPTRRYNRVIFSDYHLNDISAVPESSEEPKAIPSFPINPETPELPQRTFVPATAAFQSKPASVADLERMLGRVNRGRKQQMPRTTSNIQRAVWDETTDLQMAQMISSLELTERLNLSRQRALEQQYHLGAQSSAALELLADLSALHELTSADLLRKPAPTPSEQQRMLTIARDSSRSDLAHLPNFFARRDTLNFAGAVHGRLVLRASSSLRITHQDGREVIDSATPIEAESKNSDAANTLIPAGPELATFSSQGLNSWGEFGSELVTVLSDTQQGSIQFQHWEQSAAGPLAVFRFEVPQAASHYQVNANCGQSSRPFHAVPSYRGSVSLDAENNRVVRLQVETASDAADPISAIASVIDYVPVQIGDRWFNRPQRSLAFLTVDLAKCASADHKHKDHGLFSVSTERQLNRTTFSDYHRFGSTYRIVPEPSGSYTSMPN